MPSRGTVLVEARSMAAKQSKLEIAALRVTQCHRVVRRFGRSLGRRAVLLDLRGGRAKVIAALAAETVATDVVGEVSFIVDDVNAEKELPQDVREDTGGSSWIWFSDKSAPSTYVAVLVLAEEISRGRVCFGQSPGQALLTFC